MEKINKKEIYNQVEKLLEDMSENKSFNEDTLYKFLNIDKNVNELILESSPSDFFQKYKMKKIEENLTKYLDASTIENLASNQHSKKVAINMKNCEAWVMDNNWYDQKKEVKYFGMPDLDSYQGVELKEIESFLEQGYHPLTDITIDGYFYLKYDIEDTFDELEIDRKTKEYERQQDSINVIEIFLQDLNKEDVISSMANVDLNNTDPISNLNERINHVKELLNTLPPDDKEIYTNKVLNAVSELNKEILNKAMPEPENDYDFER